MRLVEAQITDFRNYVQALVQPSREVTAILGQNGQGKTNALEAMYLVAALRPLRAVPRRALIRRGAVRAQVELKVEHAQSGLVHDLGFQLEGGKRTLTKDGKTISTESFLGSFLAVAFTPDDLQLAKAGPDGRRRFLDRALLNARPSYLGHALRYAKAMKERNVLLAKNASDDQVDAYDTLLARDGAAIVLARQTYVRALAPRVEQRFRDIAQPAPPLSVRYRSSVDGENLAEITSRLLEELAARRPRDRRRAQTGVGPHLDDLLLELDGQVAKERASQGQHRALILALKLVELEMLSEEIGEAPVLLLDDMSSELDRTRTAQLFECVQEMDGQIILTSTAAPDDLSAILGADRELVVHGVHAGELSPAERLTEGREAHHE